MSAEILSLITDFLIIGLLSATIYYAIRLSKSLNSFKRYRDDFGNLMQELNTHIIQAEQALQNLKSVETGNIDPKTQKMLEESQDIADELDVMNKVGNKLAERLEDLISANRKIERSIKQDQEEDMNGPSGDLNGDEESTGYDQKLFSNIERLEIGAKKMEEKASSFFIQDREHEDMSGKNIPQFLQEEDDTEFLSEAEKELYEALKGR